MLHIEPHLPRHDAGHVEEVVDELHLGIGVPHDRVEPARRRRLVDPARFQDVRPPVHGIERGAQLVGQHSEELVLGAARRLRLRARLLLAREKDHAFALQPVPAADVARDLRDADDLARRRAHGRHRQGDVHHRSILAHAHRLEIADGPALPDPRQHLVLLVQALGRDDDRDGPPHRLRRRVPEQLLGRGVPGSDDPAEILAHDGVGRGAHEGREMERRQLSLLPLRDVLQVDGEPRPRGKHPHLGPDPARLVVELHVPGDVLRRGAARLGLEGASHEVGKLAPDALAQELRA